MDKTVEQVWEELKNVLVDENDNIEQEWMGFPIGTSKFEIWHWIEEEYNVSIAKDIMKFS